MTRIAVLFHSFDGHTSRIARRIGEALECRGFEVVVQEADRLGAHGVIADSDGVVIGGAIRYGRHARALERFTSAAAQTLASRPNAFFSVSLSAQGPGAKRAEAENWLRDFCDKAGWRPNLTATFAGALPYSRYNPLQRFMVRLIMRAGGGDTDTSRDYEYTDWSAVEEFAARFARTLETAPRETRAA